MYMTQELTMSDNFVFPSCIPAASVSRGGVDLQDEAPENPGTRIGFLIQFRFCSTWSAEFSHMMAAARRSQSLG